MNLFRKLFKKDPPEEDVPPERKPSVWIKVDLWLYAVEPGPEGSIHVYHTVSPQDGYYGQEVSVHFHPEYFQTHTFEEFYDYMTTCNMRPVPEFIDRNGDLERIRAAFEETEWIPKFLDS